MAALKRLADTLTQYLPAAMKPADGDATATAHPISAVASDDLGGAEAGLLEPAAAAAAATVAAAPTGVAIELASPAAVGDDDDDDDDGENDDEHGTADLSFSPFLVPCTEVMHLPEFPYDPNSFMLLRLRIYREADLALPAPAESPPVKRPGSAIMFDDKEQRRTDVGDYWFVVAYNESAVFEMFLDMFLCANTPRDLRATLELMDTAYRTDGKPLTVCAAAGVVTEPTGFDTRLRSAYEMNRGGGGAVTAATTSTATTTTTTNSSSISNQPALLNSMELLLDVLSRFRSVRVVSPQLIAVFRYWLRTGGAVESAAADSHHTLGECVAAMEASLAHAKRALTALSAAVPYAHCNGHTAAAVNQQRR